MRAKLELVIISRLNLELFWFRYGTIKIIGTRSQCMMIYIKNINYLIMHTLMNHIFI